MAILLESITLKCYLFLSCQCRFFSIIFAPVCSVTWSFRNQSCNQLSTVESTGPQTVCPHLWSFNCSAVCWQWWWQSSSQCLCVLMGCRCFVQKEQQVFQCETEAGVTWAGCSRMVNVSRASNWAWSCCCWEVGDCGNVQPEQLKRWTSRPSPDKYAAPPQKACSFWLCLFQSPKQQVPVTFSPLMIFGCSTVHSAADCMCL